MLAASLSAAVPRVAIVSRRPLCVAHRKLEGRPLDGERATVAVARRLARFLSELHAFPVERARRLGVETATETEMLDALERCVLPRLHEHERARARALATALRQESRYEPTLVHGDLTGEHVLVEPPARVAVIVVGFELVLLAWMRWRYFDVGFLRALGTVTLGGIIIALVSAGLGSAA